MKTIHKFPLKISNEVQPIQMPNGATPLTVQMQRDTPTLWAMVDEGAPKTARRFVMYGTGWPVDSPEPLAYVGTVQDQDGLVWHYFEVVDGYAALMQTFAPRGHLL